MSDTANQRIKDTYKSVLSLDNGFLGASGTLYPVQTGDGTTTALSLSTVSARIAGMTYPVTDGTAGQALLTDGTGTLYFGTSIAVASIATCTDVVLTGVASGEYLKYDGANWINSTLSGNISTFTNDANYTTLAAVAGVGYATATSATDFTNKTGNISQWTNDSGYITGNQNLTGPITSVGVATSVASQTGTGSTFVMNTSPVLVTPTLGVATATSINKVALTAPATAATLTIADNQTLTVNGSATITNGTHSGTNTGDQNAFTTFAVSGQSDVVADSATDTMTLVAGSNITITTDAGTDTITIAGTGGATLGDADYGDITVSVSGTVMTIDNSVVTYAKMQNVSATDKLLGRSTAGAGVVEEIACTAAGRALIDDATASDQRTTLGLGTIATQASSSVTITGGSVTGITDITVADGGTGVSTMTTAYAPVCAGTTATAALQVASTGLSTAGFVLVSNGASAVPSFKAAGYPVWVTLTDGATPALDASLGNTFYLDAAGNRTIGIPTNAVAGQKITIIHYANTSARTLALNTGAGGFRFGADITALTETTAAKKDYIGCIYNSIDSKWDVVAYTKGF